MADAGADARRPLRHPDSFAILLLQLAIRIESLVDSHIDQMDGRSFGEIAHRSDSSIPAWAMSSPCTTSLTAPLFGSVTQYI